MKCSVAWLALVLSLASCAFLVDFPEEAGGSGGSSAQAGNPPAGGSGGQPVAGAPEGGGGNPACSFPSDSHSTSFDWAYPLGDSDVAGDTPVALALEADGDAWVAGRVESGTIQAGGTQVTSTGDGMADAFLIEIGSDGQSQRGFVFGGAGSSTILDLAFLPNGQLLLVGLFSGTLDFGEVQVEASAPINADPPSAFDAFIAVFDPVSGDVVSAKSFGDGHYQEASAVAADDEGSIYLVARGEGEIDWGEGAYANSGAYLVKLDPNLEQVWHRELPIGTQERPDLAVLPDRSVVVAGATVQAFGFGGPTNTEPAYGGVDAFIAHYDQSGTWLWHRLFGDDLDQSVRAITIAENGDILVAGQFRSGLKEHGTIVLHSGADTEFGQDDIFLARLAGSTGDTVWTQRIFGLDGQFAHAIAVDCADRVSVVGSVFDGGMAGIDFGNGERVKSNIADDYDDLFLATYQGSDGKLLSASRLGDELREVGYALQLDQTGRVLIAGTYFGSFLVSPDVGGNLQAAGWDIFLARFDSE